jgi:hypothetical protein
MHPQQWATFHGVRYFTSAVPSAMLPETQILAQGPIEMSKMGEVVSLHGAFYDRATPAASHAIMTGAHPISKRERFPVAVKSTARVGRVDVVPEAGGDHSTVLTFERFDRYKNLNGVFWHTPAASSLFSEVTYQGGHRNYEPADGTEWEHPSYASVEGTTYLRGMMHLDGATSRLFHLPPSLRPSATIKVMTLCDRWSGCLLEISADGWVSLIAPVDKIGRYNSWLTLSGIRFFSSSGGSGTQQVVAGARSSENTGRSATTQQQTSIIIGATIGAAVLVAGVIVLVLVFRRRQTVSNAVQSRESMHKSLLENES